jgi:hypothetical protein
MVEVENISAYRVMTNDVSYNAVEIVRQLVGEAIENAVYIPTFAVNGNAAIGTYAGA